MGTAVKHEPGARVTPARRRGIAIEKNRARRVIKCVTINRGAEDLYRFWRRLENLPFFARHLISVKETSPTESHWVAKSPAGTTAEWDAVIVKETPNEYIAWESNPGSEIDNAGSVRFRPAPANQGTEVMVTLEYIPPVGALGALIARLYGEEPDIQVEEDLVRFKAFMETGEIPTTVNQPVGSGARTSRAA
ncbi:MAG TPA: SRPBCC family protein [Verrucomicrobiae bacterium]|nr:SRPBCC family protein [Verrucomicrobiae bacterium]